MVRPDRPAVRRPEPWRFPTGTEHVLDNGLRVLAYHLPGQYVASAGLLFDAPLTIEPAGSEGVAGLLAATLEEGTAAHPGTAFADAVESCGAVLDAAAGYSHQHVLVDVPVARLGEAIGLLAEAVAEPVLADADADRHRRVLVSQLRQQLATGAGRANHALRAAVIDPRYRASRPKHGEEATLSRVTGADVRALHAAAFGPRDAVLVIAGDLSGEDPLDAAAALGAWHNPAQAQGVHEVPQARERCVHLIDRPGSVQADIRWGWFTLDRRDPRWPDLQVAVNALGGAYLSRLNRVLREEKGFTYGASLVNAPLRAGGYTSVQGSFRNEVVADALALMPGLLDTAATPITDAELARAHDYLVGTSPLRYATAAGVTGGVLSLIAAGLTPDSVDEHLVALGRVTTESASRVASAVLPADGGSLVVVGDAGALEPQLRAAGWSPEVFSLDEESPTA